MEVVHDKESCCKKGNISIKDSDLIEKSNNIPQNFIKILSYNEYNINKIKPLIEKIKPSPERLILWIWKLMINTSRYNNNKDDICNLIETNVKKETLKYQTCLQICNNNINDNTIYEVLLYSIYDWNAFTPHI